MTMKWLCTFLFLVSLGSVDASSVISGPINNLSDYEIGEKIMNRYVRLQSEHKKVWDYNWTNGVALYGTNKFLLSSVQSSNPIERQNVKKYVDTIEDVLNLQVTRGLPVVTAPDLVAMSFGALTFRDIKEDCPSCDAIIDNTLEYFATEPLNWIGAYDHVGKRYRISELPFPPRWLLGSCIFIDSAMAYIPEGVRISILRKDDEALEFFLNQFDLFHNHLYEPSSGLYKQALYPKFGRKDPANWTWSRGNMYMAMGLLDTLEVLPKNHPHYKVLKDRMNRLLESVMKYVDLENGLKTLTNDPSRDNYFESSSSAFLVANVLKAQRLGLLDDESLVKPVMVLGKNIKKYLVLETADEISVNQVSGATTAFYFDWYYKRIIRPSKDKTTGIGAYLLMFSELMKSPEIKK